MTCIVKLFILSVILFSITSNGFYIRKKHDQEHTKQNGEIDLLKKVDHSELLRSLAIYKRKLQRMGLYPIITANNFKEHSSKKFHQHQPKPQDEGEYLFKKNYAVNQQTKSDSDIKQDIVTIQPNAHVSKLEVIPSEPNLVPETSTLSNVVKVTENPPVPIDSSEFDVKSFNELEILQLVPVIIDQYRLGHVTPVESHTLEQIFGPLWSLIVEEASRKPDEEMNSLLRILLESKEVSKRSAKEQNHNDILHNTVEKVLKKPVKSQKKLIIKKSEHDHPAQKILNMAAIIIHRNVATKQDYESLKPENAAENWKNHEPRRLRSKTPIYGTLDLKIKNIPMQSVKRSKRSVDFKAQDLSVAAIDALLKFYETKNNINKPDEVEEEYDEYDYNDPEDESLVSKSLPIQPLLRSGDDYEGDEAEYYEDHEDTAPVEEEASSAPTLPVTTLKEEENEEESEEYYDDVEEDTFAKTTGLRPINVMSSHTNSADYDDEDTTDAIITSEDPEVYDELPKEDVSVYEQIPVLPKELEPINKPAKDYKSEEYDYVVEPAKLKSSAYEDYEYDDHYLEDARSKPKRYDDYENGSFRDLITLASEHRLRRYRDEFRLKDRRRTYLSATRRFRDPDYVNDQPSR